jgi:hypothetical protein
MRAVSIAFIFWLGIMLSACAGAPGRKAPAPDGPRALSKRGRACVAALADAFRFGELGVATKDCPMLTADRPRPGNFGVGFVVVDGAIDGVSCVGAAVLYGEHLGDGDVTCRSPVGPLALAEAAGPGARTDRGALLLMRTGHEDLLTMKRIAREAALGVPEAAAVPAELSPSYSRLTDRNASLEYGRACGLFGWTPPRGRPEIDALVSAGRWDLMRAVLRGPNPVGRLYAADALLSQPIVTRADAQTILAMVRDDAQVSVCSPCTSYESTTSAILGGGRSLTRK